MVSLGPWHTAIGSGEESQKMKGYGLAESQGARSCSGQAMSMELFALEWGEGTAETLAL